MSFVLIQLDCCQWSMLTLLGSHLLRSTPWTMCSLPSHCSSLAKHLQHVDTQYFVYKWRNSNLTTVVNSNVSYATRTENLWNDGSSLLKTYHQTEHEQLWLKRVYVHLCSMKPACTGFFYHNIFKQVKITEPNSVFIVKSEECIKIKCAVNFKFCFIWWLIN